MKKPPGRSPKRSSNKAPQRRIIRVLTEGKLTEPEYLILLARQYRSSITLRHDRASNGSAPLTLVQEARRQQKASKNRRKADGPDFDEIWCVFDTDNHQNLDQAVNEARSTEIRTVVSNPCFELWLVLHAESQTAHIDHHKIQRRAVELGLIIGKSIGGADAKSILLGNTHLASDRARQLERTHKGNGSSSDANPSSGMWRLVKSIERPTSQD